MIIYFNLNSSGYVDGWGSTRSNKNEIELELNDNHDFFSSDPHCWKYVDGELVFDREKQQCLVLEDQKDKDKLSAENISALAILELALEIEKMKEEK